MHIVSIFHSQRTLHFTYYVKLKMSKSIVKLISTCKNLLSWIQWIKLVFFFFQISLLRAGNGQITVPEISPINCTTDESICLFSRPLPDFPIFWVCVWKSLSSLSLSLSLSGVVILHFPVLPVPPPLSSLLILTVFTYLSPCLPPPRHCAQVRMDLSCRLCGCWCAWVTRFDSV